MKKVFFKNLCNFISIFSIILFFLFAVNAPISYADILINKATFNIGEEILATNDMDYTALYNVDTKAFIAWVNTNPSPPVDVLISYGQSLGAGNYALLSFSQWTAGDESLCTNYDTCKLIGPDYIMEAIFVVLPDAPGGGGGSNGPISAPSIVSRNESFYPVCGSGVYYFEVVGLRQPINCGLPTNLSDGENSSYEIRALDQNFSYMPPSVYVSVKSNIIDSLLRRRVVTYKPVVSILSPKIDSIFSTTTYINYKVTDQNDLGNTDEVASNGLISKPVSIYYTDKIFDWNPDAGLINSDYKKLIAKDLPATGQYDWSTKDLIPGNLYRIIIDAIDNSDLTGEDVSGYFTVNFTPPVFKVKTDPTLVKIGNVKISVESSEDLQKIPMVLVTQKGGGPIAVDVKLINGVYEGNYTVQAGYDGNAQISVQGVDLAGNVGTDITSGGTFSVGINPPPKPHLVSDINKTVTYESTTALHGTVREDTEVILFVNGTSTRIIKPDSKGNFVFDKIKLDKTKNKGVNYLSVVSRDVLGTLSESANVEIKYNVVPTISIVKPTDKSLLSGQTDIVAKGADENFDTLLYTFEIISLTDYNSKNLKNNWTTIATDIPSGSFLYDSTESDDGDYMLRVRVSDGYTTATSTPVSVTIKSSSSYFRFENGRKTITKESSATINGRAIIPSDLASSVSIKVISYSTDGGATWTNIKFDNTVNVTEQKFSVAFDNLTEGTHPIMWRIRDSRNLIGTGSHTIVVDNTAPSAPIIKNPKNSAVVTDNDDEDLKKAGIQISVNGTAEAGSIASLVFNGQTFTTKVSLLGEFSFSGITFDKIGKQELQFFATDEAGNKSKTTVLNIIYNNPPLITFINPIPFGGLSGKAVLSWNITDIDGDIIKNVEVSYRNAGGSYKTLLTNADAKGIYTWDTSKLLESSNYELKISATDSITPVSTTESFFIDRTPPTLLSFSIKKGIINKKVGFSGEGIATDVVSGIGDIEYSIKNENDKEKGPWYKAIITKGYLQKQASFIIKYPNDLSDGSYTVYVRAVDIAGNVSNELTQNINIDRTAPTVGGFFITNNNLNLIPDQDGKISYYKNSTFTFAISIQNDTKIANVNIGDRNIKLTKNITSGLWEASLTINTDLPQNISITAADDSGNITKSKEIGTISGLNSGNVVVTNSGSPDEPISGVSIHVYKNNENTGHYDEFIPTLNGVASIIETDKNGEYNLVLPAGKYQLVAVKSGFKVVKKDITLTKTEIINNSFITKRIGGLEKMISDIFNNWFY